MKTFNPWRFSGVRGFSLAEIMVVVALSTLLFLGAHRLFSSTTMSFKKGTDLLNVQMLTERVCESIKSDIRCLTALKSVSPTSIQFSVTKNGKESEVKYTFRDKNLFREEIPGGKAKDFQSESMIEFLKFNVRYIEKNGVKTTDFHSLEMAMQLKSNDIGKDLGLGSKLSIVTQFYSKCFEKKLIY